MPRRKDMIEAVGRDKELSDEILELLGTSRGAGNFESALGSLPISTTAYEAIVRRFGRPSLFIWNNTYESPASEVWRGRLETARPGLEAAIPSVGRVEIVGEEAPFVGTAWMIAPGIAVTNRHVAEIFAASRNGTFPFRKNPAGDPYEVRVDFLEEFDNSDTNEFRVAEVLYIAPRGSSDPDLAFLRMEGEGLPPHIPASTDPLIEGEPIAVIGYPARDSRNSLADQARIFDQEYDVKRLAPGELLRAEKRGVFLHDATTLGGNSGSVVLRIDTGEAVGLHFAGSEGEANFAVGIDVVLDRLHSFTAAAVDGAVDAVEAPVEAPASAEDLWGRAGYAADFLDHDVPIPLPKPMNGGRVAKSVSGPSGDTTELNYEHFSVVMDEARGLALLTAVNIDGAKYVAVKRGRDSWYRDPRLLAEDQRDNELYKNNPLDRGHLVRRLDPAWGEPDEVERAIADTFHWTNCAPQHSSLNQRTWLGLESYLLGSAETHGFKASIFSGPIFRDDDPVHRGNQIPQAYWKVAVMVRTPEDGQTGLVATAYVVSQADLIEDLPPEFAYGAFKTYQLPIRRLQRILKLEFPSALHDADPMKREGPSGARVLWGPEDIDLTRPSA